MLNIYTEFIFWACISVADLFISIAVLRLTKRERHAKKEYELSTCTRSIPASLTVSKSFLCLSILAGCLNSATAYLRLRRIYFLEIPILPWLHPAMSNREVQAFLEADWIVAFNDWTSLLLAATFLCAAFFNFATLGQLWLAFRENRRKLSSMPIAGEEASDEKASAVRVGGGNSFAMSSKPYARRGNGI